MFLDRAKDKSTKCQLKFVKIKKVLKDGYKILSKNKAIFFPALILSLVGSLRRSILLFYPLTILYGVSISIIEILMTVFFTGVIIRMAYETKIRRKTSFSKTLDFVAKKYLTLLIAGIINFCIVVAGLIAFILPGIYLGIRLFFYDFSILIDNQKAVSSLKKSWKITRKNFWSLFVLTLILFLISFLLVFLPLLFIVGIMVVFLPSALIFLPQITDLIIFILSIFIVPWAYCVYTCAYLQLKRKSRR